MLLGPGTGIGMLIAYISLGRMPNMLPELICWLFITTDLGFLFFIIGAIINGIYKHFKKSGDY